MTVRMHRVQWEDKAACLDTDEPEIFFELENAADAKRIADPVVVAQALALCESCPIIDRCFHEAVYSRSLGIWGGTTANERGVSYNITERSGMWYDENGPIDDDQAEIAQDY